MFVLLVMLVRFFIVTISSWWLEALAVAENERTATKSALASNSQPITPAPEPLSPRPSLATITN